MTNLIINEIKIEDMIYEVSGKQVMLDSDLAVLYNTDTKRINEAVKRKLSTVFTEQGVYMLATILKSDVATKVTIAIMNVFVIMKNYISDYLMIDIFDQFKK